MKKCILFSLFGILLINTALGQNVGISILSPQAKLHIKGSENIPQLIIEANATQSNTQPLIRLRKATGNNLLSIHSDDSTNVFLGLNTGRVNVPSGSNGTHNTFIGSLVGFSNTSGNLNTAVGSQSLYFNTTGFSNTAIGVQALLFNVGGQGNTSIGNKAMYTNVNGNNNTAVGSLANFSNTSGAQNVSFGYQALYGNTTGWDNVAIGTQSLQSNISSFNNTAVGSKALRFNTSADNTGVGSSALYNNTNGNQNTAVGASANFSNTTGSQNSSLGYQALQQSTTGSENVAIGTQALQSNISSFNNTAIGSKALRFNTSGDNTAVGSSALYNNTSGNQNTAVSAFSLYTNTSGSKNTSVGNGTLYDNTVGSENTASGFEALRKNTTGQHNSALGAGSLFDNTTGHFNTAIGDSSLNSNVTGNNNTAIGYKANVNTNNLTNATAIGSKAMVASSNSIVLGSIEGVNGASSGSNVGIGTTAPHASSKLEVTSTTQGMLIPRMTTSQRKLISSPAAGLMVYDLDKLTIYLYDGIKWYPMLFTSHDSNLPLYAVQASDAMPNNSFGNAVSLFGNYAVIGSPGNDVGGNTDQGSAYIFHRAGGHWVQQAILNPTNGSAKQYFGASVEMGTNGESVVIGAPKSKINGDTLKGCVYIFLRSGSTWTQQAILTASDGEAYDEFGTSVSMDGDYVVVGCPGDDVIQINQGSAYIFYKGSGWYDNQPFQSKLLATDVNFQDLFGGDVSISNDYVIIGSTGWHTSTLSGAAFIFFRTGTIWTLQARINGYPNTSTYFGKSVSLDGDYAIVGDNIADPSTPKGAAYIFVRNGTSWSQQAYLTAIDGVQDDNFGLDVSISGNLVQIGAPFHDYSAVGNEGASYLYQRDGTTWTLIRKSTDESNQPFQSFGVSVAIHGFNSVIGIPIKNNSKGEVQFVNLE